MKRTNSVTDALNTNKVLVDVGDGIVIPLPTDGVFGGAQGAPGVGVPEGGTSGQVVQRTAAGTIWATPSKELVGLEQVDNTADKDKPLSEAQWQALTSKADLVDGKVPAGQLDLAALVPSNGARPVGKGELVINVKDYGAVGDGVTDDTVAIQAAADAAYAKSQDCELYVPPSIYRISSTVVIRTGLAASQAEFRYYGTGIAVQLGTTFVGAVSLTRKTIRLPRVLQYTNGYNPKSHDGTSVGVLAVNLISCDLYVPFIQHFEDGLVMHGQGAGFGYNTIYLQSIWGNHRGVVFSRDATGWSNQNLILGGRISPASWYSNDAAGCYISINGNQNTFVGVSIEGAGEYLHRIKFLAARYNTFISPRFEATAWEGKPGVLWGTGSYYNRIEGGYNGVNVAETFESGTGGNTLRHAEGATEFRSNQAGALSIPPTVSTAINTWQGVNGFRYAYDPTTGVFTPRQGRWQINATVGLSFTTAGGYADVKIVRSDGAVLAVQRFVPVLNVLTTAQISVRENFTEGQGFRIEVSHTSSGAAALSSTSHYCKLQAEYLGY